MIAMSFSSMEPQATSFTQNMAARWHTYAMADAARAVR
jgi:hypothetical protein